MTRVGMMAMATLMMLVFSSAIWAQPGGRGGTQRGGATGGATGGAPGADRTAQPGGRGGTQRGGDTGGTQRGGGPGGGFSIDNMWDRIAPRLKENVDISDEEWPLIEPLVRDVITKQFEMSATQRAATSGGGGFNFGSLFGGGGGRGGRGGEEAEEEPTVAALKKTIENKRAKPKDIADKMAAVRAARVKAQKEAEAKLKEQEAAVAEARKKLREVLTPLQEAQFFLLTILN